MAVLAALTGVGFGQINPFASRKAKAPRGAVRGVIYMSDGKAYEGMVYTTPGHRMPLFDPKFNEYVNCSLKLLKEIRIKVVEKRVEKEWRFKEMGNDEKVFTGKTYPRKDFGAVIVFKSGREKKANIARGFPIYCIMKDGKRKRVLVQPHIQGAVGQTLKDVVHPAKIDLSGKPRKDTAKTPQKTGKTKPTSASDKPAGDRKEVPASTESSKAATDKKD